jgi:hypothetical protein
MGHASVFPFSFARFVLDDIAAEARDNSGSAPRESPPPE